jgi:hypothetical protein
LTEGRAEGLSITVRLTAVAEAMAVRRTFRKAEAGRY